MDKASLDIFATNACAAFIATCFQQQVSMVQIAEKRSAPCWCLLQASAAALAAISDESDLVQRALDNLLRAAKSVLCKPHGRVDNGGDLDEAHRNFHYAIYRAAAGDDDPDFATVWHGLKQILLPAQYWMGDLGSVALLERLEEAWARKCGVKDVFLDVHAFLTVITR